MRVMKPMALGFLTRPFEFMRQFRLGAAVLSFVPLGTERALFADPAMWKMVAEELPPDQPLDIAMAKRRAEFLVAGHAFAPGGTPVRALRVSARLGQRSKSLLVVGDRFRDADGSREPEPFTRMPLDWTRAAGGPGVAENPLGRGRSPVATPAGPRIPFANIEDPSVAPEYRQQRPAGFGAMDIAWPQRARFAGTHDDRWLRDDFPGFARDMDWRIFNAAPEDQQFPAFLSGDEEYALENMHPEQPVLTGRLPGIRPRLLLRRRGRDALEDIPLALTTVWFFPHRMRLVLVHHAETPIEEEDGRDIEVAMIGAETNGTSRPVSHFEDVMRRRLDPNTGAVAALRDADLVPQELLVPDPTMEAEMALHATEGLAYANGRRRLEKETAERRAMVASYGLDPDEHGPKRLEPEERTPTLDELPAHIDRILAEGERQKAEHTAWRAERDRELEDLLTGPEMTYEKLQEERAQKPAGPPTFTAAGKRMELELLAAQMRAAGADDADVQNILNDRAMQSLWQDAEQQLRDAYQQTAQEQDPAPRVAAFRQQEIAANLASQRDWPRGNFCGVDLRGVDLSGRDLSEAWFDGADLTGANLTGARLGRAVLAHARLAQARLDGADLAGANLGRADLSGASLRRAVLGGAILDHANLSGASLRGATLEGARLTETMLTDTDLAGAVLNDVQFINTNLTGLSASGAEIQRTLFLETPLDGANFASARLVESVFLKCEAASMDCTGADMRKVRFVEGCRLDGCRFVRTNLAEANLREVAAQGCDFTDAILDDADLSDAKLAGSRLLHVRARRARFVVTDLRDAILARSDFMQALMARADLRGADLTEASFYEADLARVRTDGTTKHQGMFQVRMRLRPRRIT